jgi:hypothetical protein
MRFLEPDELARLAETHPSTYRPLVHTAGYVGLRWGELAFRIPARVFGGPKDTAGHRASGMPWRQTRFLITAAGGCRTGRSRPWTFGLSHLPRPRSMDGATNRPGTAYSIPHGDYGRRRAMKASTISETVLGIAVLATLVAGPVAEASNPSVVTGRFRATRSKA